MAKTRDQMIYRALAKLGHHSTTNPASAEDHELVDGNLEPIFAELGALKKFYVADYESYDEETFDALAEILAAAHWADYAQDEAAWRTRREDAINRLEIISAPSGTGEPLKTDCMLRAGARRYGNFLLG